MFKLSKWALKRIDRIRRRFLWNGSDNERKDHCLVQWKKVTHTKHLGGLDVMDLERFNRALHLRWPWLQWTDQNKPWNGMLISISAPEEDLFHACTTIQVGNDTRTKFWHDRWIDGQALKALAPTLFKLAWGKNTLVAEAYNNNRWMRGLRHITTMEEVSQFANLWKLLNQITLTELPDSITWQRSPTGHYSVHSAYASQFLGSFPDHNWDNIWKARAENKCKFFCLLTLQNRL
jgi:hypothetical protein